MAQSRLEGRETGSQRRNWSTASGCRARPARSGWCRSHPSRDRRSIAAVEVDRIRVLVADRRRPRCRCSSGPAGRPALGGDPNHAVGRLDAVQRRGRRTLHDLDVDSMSSGLRSLIREGPVASISLAEPADVERARARGFSPSGRRRCSTAAHWRARRCWSRGSGSGCRSPWCRRSSGLGRRPRGRRSDCRTPRSAPPPSPGATSMVETALATSSFRCSPVAVVTISSSCTGAPASAKSSATVSPGATLAAVGRRPVAESQHPDRVAPGRDVAELVAAFLIGTLDPVGFDEDDPGRLERLARRLVGHHTADRALLRHPRETPMLTPGRSPCRPRAAATDACQLS